ncbi:MAG: hypothetical protein ABJB86_16655 [Bacteroidota bacterium]
MSYFISAISSLSIGIAAIIACWRFRKIHPVFRPFIYCIWLALANEILSIILVQTIRTNAVNSNIYVLLESLLIVWQFRKWGMFERYKIVFKLLLGLLVLAWFTENFMLFSIRQFSSWFRIFYSFIIVLLSISLLNRQILGDKGILLKNPVALICLSFIIYYTYKVLVETFWVYGLNESGTFRNKVYIILNYINLFSNLIYALAVLWMPTKHRFTMQYSSALPS